MGYFKRLEAEARQVARTPRDKVVGVTVTATDETLKALDFIPILMREKVLKEAVRKAAGQVRTAARKNLKGNRSRDTGTEEKLAKKQQQSRSDTRDIDLWKSIHVKVVTDEQGVLGMIGPRRPHGNHGNLIENGWNMYFWGKESGQFWTGEARGFLRRAHRDTTTQQRKAMLQHIKRRWIQA